MQSVTYKPFMLNVVMLNAIMLNAVLLNAVMLNAVMLNIVILNVVMLSVVVPNKLHNQNINDLAYYMPFYLRGKINPDLKLVENVLLLVQGGLAVLLGSNVIKLFTSVIN
jgi:hypothetical protein